MSMTHPSATGQSGSVKDLDTVVRSARVQANGHTFHVIEQGQGPVVLFCHGFPDTAETWRSQMQAVANAGYRAIALDMRGYGQSYAPTDPSLYSALHTVSDLVGVLDALDIPTAVLVGHDWGADVAQRAMVIRPDRFRALVSLSIPIAPRADKSFYGGVRDQGLEASFYAFDMMKPDAEARFASAEKSIPSVFYWLSGSPPPGTGWDPADPDRHMLRPAPVDVPAWAEPDFIRHTIDAFTRTGFTGGLNYYRAAQDTFELMSAYKNQTIQQPSLYLWGAEDGLCQFFHPTPPSLESLRRDAPGLIEVIRIEGAGHWLQHEARDRVNAELLKFLGTIATARLTPLMIAAGLGQLTPVELMLKAGADVLALDPLSGATALHKAALSGHVDVVARLLDHGAFIDQQSPILGHTALMDAVVYKDTNVVRTLLAGGARSSISNHWGERAIDIARRDGLDEIAGLIDAHDGAAQDVIAAQALVPAIKAGDQHEVERLIASGANVNLRIPMTGSFDDDYTPLAIAAREGHAGIVNILLEAGADPRQTIGLFQGTALHEASYFGHADVVRTFTEGHERVGTNASKLDAQGPYNGMTPLHDAVWHNHVDAAHALVNAGHPLHLQTHAGLTAEQLAVHYGYDELARDLRDASAVARSEA